MSDDLNSWEHGDDEPPEPTPRESAIAQAVHVILSALVLGFFVWAAIRIGGRLP